MLTDWQRNESYFHYFLIELFDDNDNGLLLSAFITIKPDTQLYFSPFFFYVKGIHNIFYAESYNCNWCSEGTLIQNRLKVSFYIFFSLFVLFCYFFHHSSYDCYEIYVTYSVRIVVAEQFYPISNFIS